MTVPDFQSLMLPALRVLSDGAAASISEVRKRVAKSERLSTSDLSDMVPSNRQTTFSNRVSWAITYMSRAGLVNRVRHGVYQITKEGKDLLEQNRASINMKVLEAYPSYVNWKKNSRSEKDPKSGTTPNFGSSTPDEMLESAARQLREELESDVLDRVRESEPAFLEHVVVDTLIAMGYGGGDSNMGKVTGRSGDGGIDGTIREDALGLDEVYVQAKKYSVSNSVGESELRNFAGALDVAGTDKGVFVTTASFTTAALSYVERSNKRIVLIDGNELARLMVNHNVGVRTRNQFQIKRIDEDYFSQEE